MRFLNLAGLWLALIIPAIIALYLLKPHYQERLVSSTWLWEQAVRDIEASSPWQRLRRNLLLLLQLLAALLLVLTIMRPSMILPGEGGRHLIVILDASASMRATDARPSRFAAAQAEITRVIDNLDSNGNMTLIAMTDQPQVLASASGDKVQLRQALNQAEVSNGPAALEPALSLAAALSERDPQAQLMVFSDGRAIPPERASGLKCPGSFHQVGRSDDNLAITLLSTRRIGGKALVLARVQNFSDAPRQSELELRGDQKLYDARSITLAARESRDITWNDLPGGPEVWQARLDRKDIYMADNQAYTVTDDSTSRRVLLVSSGNVFLEKSISLVPGIQLFKTTPGNYSSSMKDYQLYVFDGLVPARLPRAAVFILNPPAGQKLLPVGGDFKSISEMQATPGDEVMRYVDTAGWHIRQARRLNTPYWASTLLEAKGEPLLLKGELGGQKMAAATFDLHQSNIPLQAGFPILIQNLCSWLLPHEVSAPVLDDSGQGFDFIPAADSDRLTVVYPDGQELKFKAPLPHHFNTGEPGLYRIITRGGGTSHEYYLAKNAGNILESDLKPLKLTELGAVSSRNSHQKGVARKDLWPWAAAAVFLLLLLEWEVYRRGY